MTVKTIVSKKGRHVVTIEPSATLEAAIATLAEHRIGALVMTREVVTCSEAETAVSIMERMTIGKFRHIPVVERDQLAGIVSIGDIVKHRLGELEQESTALRDYIQSA